MKDVKTRGEYCPLQDGLELVIFWGQAQYNFGNEVDWHDLIFPWTRSVVESLITKRLIPLHVSPAAFPTDLEGC